MEAKIVLMNDDIDKGVYLSIWFLIEKPLTLTSNRAIILHVVLVILN